MVPDAKSKTFVIKNEKENIKLILSGKVMRFKILQIFVDFVSRLEKAGQLNKFQFFSILAILIYRLQKLNSVH